MTLKTETVLDSLVAGVREDLAADKSAVSETELRGLAQDAVPARSLFDALRRPAGGVDSSGVDSSGVDPDGGKISVIAEVKKASPSKGLIVDRFAPREIAAGYQAGGAAAVSVLTERRRFLGHLDHLREVREVVDLPIIRKEFIFDPYQIIEARAAGADAILLIAAVLDVPELIDLQGRAAELGMDALIEVHTEEEMARALEAGVRILGVNNRNLKTFETDAAHTFRLIGQIPAARREELVFVSESGIFGWKEVAPLVAAGVDAILVGESLMRSADPAALLRELRGLGGQETR
ncbi:MAG: indole-3-glycerol phosphate synthase TrpC [bacterium]|nr:indole-3-glycerol phosphate synthase TrpC [bacterium]